ncbi:unnamed protein product [Brassicogethes aeneus]|uniref:Uncharacterized protein n=1 Tax=Brassicogethes aeneus TaxID=1431903 RepID=A0A9P0BD61_BRAAE|nr:unnamed protein product [Brassicogethes aeneus]
MSTRSNKEKETKSLIKETLAELFTDDEFINKLLKNFNDKVDKKLEEMNQKIKNSEIQINMLEQKIDQLQQAEKLKNICIYGIPEENKENLNLKIIENMKIAKIQTNNDDILSSYRIGKKMKI